MLDEGNLHYLNWVATHYNDPEFRSWVNSVGQGVRFEGATNQALSPSTISYHLRRTQRYTHTTTPYDVIPMPNRQARKVIIDKDMSMSEFRQGASQGDVILPPFSNQWYPAAAADSVLQWVVDKDEAYREHLLCSALAALNAATLLHQLHTWKSHYLNPYGVVHPRLTGKPMIDPAEAIPFPTIDTIGHYTNRPPFITIP